MVSIAKICVDRKTGYPIRPVIHAIQILVLCGLPIFSTDVAAQGLSNADREPLTVHGMVLNRVTREPISRALVYSPDNRYATLTDDRGRFQFTFPAEEADPVGNLSRRGDSPAGARFRSWISTRPNYFLARKPGYLFEANGSQAILSADSPQSDITLLLDPEGLIVGHVRFSTEDSADRMQVDLLRRDFYEGHERWAFANSFSTWSDGEFRFYELMPGTYKLISHEQLDRDFFSFNSRQAFGFQPGFYPNAPDFDSASPIQIKAGTVFQANLAPVRSEYYPVKIAVGNAPADSYLNVFVYPRGHPGPGYSLGYNGNEQRIEGMLPNGSYTARVSTQGENSATGILDFTIRGAPHEGSVVRLIPNANIAVNVREEFGSDGTTNQAQVYSMGVVDGDGRAVPRRTWNVMLVPSSNYVLEQPGFARPIEGGDGPSAVINAVSPGNYWVRVRCGRGYAASVVRGGVDLLHHPLVVGAGESSLPIEITLRDDGAEVSGSVQIASSSRNQFQDPAQSYVAAAHIYFVPASEGAEQFREALVSSDGAFQAEQLPPGVYRVLAFSRPQEGLESAGPDFLRKFDSKGQLVQLYAGQKKELALPLVPIGE